MTPVIGWENNAKYGKEIYKWFKMPIIDSAVPRDEIKTGMKYYAAHFLRHFLWLAGWGSRKARRSLCPVVLTPFSLPPDLNSKSGA